MELQGDVGQVEACFGLFRHCVNRDTRYVHGLHRTYHRLRNYFGHTPMMLLCYVGQVEGCFSPFGVSVNLNARKVLILHRMNQGHGNP
jgi:hypothetical protein